MKKIALLLITCFLGASFSAQKIGVVDTNYILSKLPQFQEAEKRLNSQITQWQSDIQQLQSDLERKKEAFESERVLLVGDQLKLREKEISDLELNIKNTIGARFGSEGEINQLRSNLTKPYQDQIWNAIKTVSTKNSLGIVLDKSNNISVIFLDKKYDYTDAVLNILVKNLPEVEKETNTRTVNPRGRGRVDGKKFETSKKSNVLEGRALEIKK